MLRGVLARKKKSVGEAEVTPTIKEAPKLKRSQLRYLSVVAWMAGLLVMIYLIGHLVSVPLFVLLYLKLHGERWLLTISVSLGALAVVYLGFIIALGRPLHEGLLFRLF